MLKYGTGYVRKHTRGGKIFFRVFCDTAMSEKQMEVFIQKLMRSYTAK